MNEKSSYPTNPETWRTAIREGMGLNSEETRDIYQSGAFPFEQLENWLVKTYSTGYSPEFLPALLRNIGGLVAWVYGDGDEPYWPGSDPVEAGRLQRIMYDQLAVHIYEDNHSMGQAAAQNAADCIKEVVSRKGTANIILATGNSQLSFFQALVSIPLIPWRAVNIFHMDEYLDLPPGHPAGFASFLQEHLLRRISGARFYPVPGHPTDVETACGGYEMLLRAHPVDLCCLGIGENGHIAFNEPFESDFDDPMWVKKISLSEASRRQQVGEGHFASLEEVPTEAVTLTIPALRSAKMMLCIVPEKRKAKAVRAALLDPVSTACPASILRLTPRARLYLDREAAELIW
jgi:glucosamine-6-phosphate deaminase